jgi:hypothetical protein
MLIGPTLQTSGTIYLIDFGCSSAIDKEIYTETFKGTYAYTSMNPLLGKCMSFVLKYLSLSMY